MLRLPTNTDDLQCLARDFAVLFSLAFFLSIVLQDKGSDPYSQSSCAYFAEV